VEGDVRKKEDTSCAVEKTVRKLGKLDILVNGAVGNFLVAAEDLSPNGFKTGKLIWLAVQLHRLLS
jgi:peroxisomal 2,4-dienoyl-CoA reductase